MKLAVGIGAFAVGVMALGFAYTQAGAGERLLMACGGGQCPASQPATDKAVAESGAASVVYLDVAATATAPAKRSIRT